MLQREVFPYYRRCCTELERVYSLLKTRFDNEYVTDLCNMRGYVLGEEQRNLIASMKLGACEIDNVEELGDMRKELGLVSDKDNFLLNNRFIIPVYDIASNLTALIGYYPDYKKYITTPSPFFSKECMFFNFAHAYELSWREFGGVVFLVEGIFDCLSLRSIGLPAIATMGASVSGYKCELLKLFKKVIGIPDDDKTGRASLNRYSKRGWKVPDNTTLIRFHGTDIDINAVDKKHIKDMDNFVTFYDASDVREILLSFKDSKEDVEDLEL